MACRGRSAYTLAELLVVFGIITILGSLAMGAISYVLGLARATACMNNLRQIGMVAALYADENSGRYPAEGNKGDPDPDTSPAWFYRLPPLIEQTDVRGRNSIFQCPCYDWNDPQVFDHASPKSLKMNGRLDNRGRTDRYLLGSAPDESEIVFFADAVAGDTGMGQWGALAPSAVCPDRHGGRVNLLFLDGHGLSRVVGDADTDWETELKWTSRVWE